MALNDPSGATSVPAGLLAGIADLVLIEFKLLNVGDGEIFKIS